MTVDSGELRRIAEEVRQNASSYNKCIEEIYNKLKGTLNEYWTGSDYDEFIKNMNSKRGNADSITTSLKKLAGYLDEKAADADRI